MPYNKWVFSTFFDKKKKNGKEMENVVEKFSNNMLFFETHSFIHSLRQRDRQKTFSHSVICEKTNKNSSFFFLFLFHFKLLYCVSVGLLCWANNRKKNLKRKWRRKWKNVHTKITAKKMNLNPTAAQWKQNIALSCLVLSCVVLSYFAS